MSYHPGQSIGTKRRAMAMGSEVPSSSAFVNNEYPRSIGHTQPMMPALTPSQGQPGGIVPIVPQHPVVSSSSTSALAHDSTLYGTMGVGMSPHPTAPHFLPHPQQFTGGDSTALPFAAASHLGPMPYQFQYPSPYSPYQQQGSMLGGNPFVAEHAHLSAFLYRFAALGRVQEAKEYVYRMLSEKMRKECYHQQKQVSQQSALVNNFINTEIDTIEKWSAVFGWIAFFMWSVSFYPQPIKNCMHKAVEGFSLEFNTLNTLGFSCYLLYNSLVISGALNVSIVVHWNDVAFALNAVILTVITQVQFFYYCRCSGKARPKIPQRDWIFIFVSIAVVVVSFIIAAIGGFSYDIPLQILGFIKIIVTITKYIPQAILNYRRKTTYGFAISNIMLDLGGSITQFVQMVLDCVDAHSTSPMFGNIPKFCLSLVPFVYDTLLIIQFCMYGTEPEPVDPACQCENDNLLEAETPEKDSKDIIEV
ncbi:Lysosomal cystine transporter like protein [Aduncisulcus paluster]|uniref:Lysosomal cystine transporter like protein n=1 Tax=Aduncisulcus paluster TaxID=2918883 RepID=A0ABQ5KU34_9EUKA|nr:Lysosomal cystine transporter like protein [Aduncisulcus paluster]